MKGVNKAIEELKAGRPILIYDSEGREEETDIVIGSEFSTPEYVKMQRKDGGGLLCVALHPEIANRLELPFLTDVWKEAKQRFPVFARLWPDDIPYDEKSAFSITINHRKTFTGISDIDRSLTITELARTGGRVFYGDDFKADEFGREFRSPGHVVLLRAAEGLLNSRRGHTELSVTMMEIAGLTPMATICEMLGDDCRSLGIDGAREYAKEHDLAFIEGRETIEWCLKNSHLALKPTLRRRA